MLKCLVHAKPIVCFKQRTDELYNVHSKRINLVFNFDNKLVLYWKNYAGFIVPIPFRVTIIITEFKKRIYYICEQ